MSFFGIFITSTEYWWIGDWVFKSVFSFVAVSIDGHAGHAGHAMMSDTDMFQVNWCLIVLVSTNG